MAASSLTVMVQLQDQVTAPARQATKAVDNFTNSVQRSARGANQLGANMGKATRDTRKFAMTGMQQAGYQVGDFFVQVGMGTSALQAFGQQGSQLLGIFGPFGAVLGAVVAITAAVGNAFMKSAEEASDLAKNTTLLTEAQDDFQDIIDLDAIDNLKEKFGDLNTSVIQLVNSERILQATQRATAFNKTIGALRETSSEFQKLIDRQEDSEKSLFSLEGISARTMQVIGDSTKGIAKEFGTVKENLTSVKDIMDKVASSETEEMLRKNVAEALIKIGGVIDPTSEKGQELIAALKAVGDAANQISPAKIELLGEGAEEAAKKLDAMKERSESVTDTISEGFGSAFGDILKGTKDASDAFRDMASKIVNRLIDILVVESLVQSIAGSAPIKKFSEKLTGLATGGPVTSGQTYLVGEKGPELFTSGTNGRIIPNHQMQGGATVVQNINISTGVSQTVRAEITQLMPQIANSAKAAVLDAKQRGGTFSKAF
jgi:hypothetical protein